LVLVQFTFILFHFSFGRWSLQFICFGLSFIYDSISSFNFLSFWTTFISFSGYFTVSFLGSFGSFPFHLHFVRSFLSFHFVYLFDRVNSIHSTFVRRCCYSWSSCCSVIDVTLLLSRCYVVPLRWLLLLLLMENGRLHGRRTVNGSRTLHLMPALVPALLAPAPTTTASFTCAHCLHHRLHLPHYLLHLLLHLPLHLHAPALRAIALSMPRAVKKYGNSCSPHCFSR